MTVQPVMPTYDADDESTSLTLALLQPSIPPLPENPDSVTADAFSNLLLSDSKQHPQFLTISERSNALVDLDLTTQRTLETLHRDNKRLKLIQRRDVDSISLLCALGELAGAEWHVMELFKGAVPFLKLQRRSGMKISMMNNGRRFPLRSIHSVPHSQIGFLACELGKFSVFVLSVFASDRQPATTFYDGFRRSVLELGPTAVPIDLYNLVTESKFGKPRKARDIVSISKQVFTKVRSFESSFFFFFLFSFSFSCHATQEHAHLELCLNRTPACLP
jgi:hypothetical protein